MTKTEETRQGELRVMTSRFGELRVRPEKIITMTSPFLGFPDSKRFLLKPHGEESPFMWLQSLDDPKLAFVVTQALLLAPRYQPIIPGFIRQELDAAENAPLEILLILTIPRDNPQKMTANLLGPVVINSQKRLAKQVLQDPTVYDACWPVFAVEAAEEEANGK
ncbi:flagellar assembly protein FliW [Thiovibrio sp. JS02]